ncbi:MAG: CPBP family intramembrane glutamic endopeptidase [Acidobacteriota bacterium]
MSTPAQAGEEIGWRGYALPGLAARVGFGPASLIIGVVWASWHLAIFFTPASDTFGPSFPLYLRQVTALSATMAWLHWRTGGSLLPVMLFHAAVNNTKDIVPSALAGATNSFSMQGSLAACLAVALLWLGAAWCLAKMWTARRA